MDLGSDSTDDDDERPDKVDRLTYVPEHPRAYGETSDDEPKL